jgi:acetyl esterase
MSLNPKVKEYLKSLPTSPPATIQERRKRFEENVVPHSERPPIHALEDRVVLTEDYNIPIRIYTPKAKGPYPLFIFFHGGAFVLGNLETHDVFCRDLANRTGYKVIAVDYRLAPEHLYPAPLNDCYAVTKWVVENSEELQGDVNRIVVGGSSAGGNLAASVTLMARDKNEFSIMKQVLIYPCVDAARNEELYPSMKENGKGYGLTIDEKNPHIKNPIDAFHPDVSPIRAESLGGLPPTLVMTAEFDPLRDEAEAFLVKLLEAGVRVEGRRFIGTIHGFMSYFRELDDYKEGFNLIESFLRE